VFSRTNGPAGAPQLPPQRYFSPVSRVAALSAKLYADIKGARHAHAEAHARERKRKKREMCFFGCADVARAPRRRPAAHLPARPRGRGTRPRNAFAALLCALADASSPCFSFQAIFADPLFQFADPAALFITPDHYVYRMLHSQGIALEALGIPGADGVPFAPVPAPRDVWRTLAANMHLFRGTPVRWMAVCVACGGVSECAHAESACIWRVCVCGALQTSLWFREALALNFNITQKLTPQNADAMCVAFRVSHHPRARVHACTAPHRTAHLR
jgi:hypothetical protein